MKIERIDTSEEITKLNDFNDELKKWKEPNDTVIYRGQYNINRSLMPKIARPSFPGSNTQLLHEPFAREEDINNNFYLRLPRFGYGSPVTESKLYQMIIGQHHGLPTRLLDFTTNPLVALFFALTQVDENEPKPDYHVIWCIKYDSTKMRQFDRLLSHSLNEMDTTIFYPPQIDHRIFSQQALFIFCRHPYTPLENQYLFYYNTRPQPVGPREYKLMAEKIGPILIKAFKKKGIKITENTNIKKIDGRHIEIIENNEIIARIEKLPHQGGYKEAYIYNEEYRMIKPFLKLVIPNDWKIRENLLDELDEIGINYETLFPDLDGVSRYLSQKY